MRKIRIKNILFIFSFLLCVLKSFGQQNICCNNQIVPSIDSSGETLSGEKYFSDTLTKCIRLIFEENFDDSILIKLDDNIVYNSKIVTHKPYFPRVKVIDVDYSMKKNPPVLLIKKSTGECFWFYLKQGYRVACINYYKELKMWGVELSNIQKQYI